MVFNRIEWFFGFMGLIFGKRYLVGYFFPISPDLWVSFICVFRIYGYAFAKFPEFMGGTFGL